MFIPIFGGQPATPEDQRKWLAIIGPAVLVILTITLLPALMRGASEFEDQASWCQERMVPEGYMIVMDTETGATHLLNTTTGMISPWSTCEEIPTQDEMRESVLSRVIQVLKSVWPVFPFLFIFIWQMFDREYWWRQPV